MNTPLDNPILVGVIGAAQGIRGEVRVKSFTADPEALAEYGVLFDVSGKRFEVLSARPAKTMVIVRFLGINDRNEAEKLNGTELFIERANLPDDQLEEGEFFLTDLEGLEAYDAEGKYWGVVTAIFDFGGGDLLELKPRGGKPVVIPFSMAAVPEVDLEAGRILVDPAAAGLTGDDGKDEPRPTKGRKPRET